jgi:hypothetical protein
VAQSLHRVSRAVGYCTRGTEMRCVRHEAAVGVRVRLFILATPSTLVATSIPSSPKIAPKQTGSNPVETAHSLSFSDPRVDLLDPGLKGLEGRPLTLLADAIPPSD